MGTLRRLTLALLVSGAVLGCSDADFAPSEPSIESMEISTAELPSEFDSSRTFHIAAGTVSDPEGHQVVVARHQTVEAEPSCEAVDALYLGIVRIHEPPGGGVEERNDHPEAVHGDPHGIRVEAHVPGERTSLFEGEVDTIGRIPVGGDGDRLPPLP